MHLVKVYKSLHFLTIELKRINGIKPQSKLWTLSSAASGELNHTFSSAIAEREGGLKYLSW